MARRREGGGLVYSSGVGAICPACERPVAECCCSRKSAAAVAGPVRVLRERKGRGGRTVTVIAGLGLTPRELRSLARELKRLCGSGGTVKDGRIEIQGEHAAALLDELRRRGWSPRG